MSQEQLELLNALGLTIRRVGRDWLVTDSSGATLELDEEHSIVDVLDIAQQWASSLLGLEQESE